MNIDQQLDLQLDQEHYYSKTNKDKIVLQEIDSSNTIYLDMVLNTLMHFPDILNLHPKLQKNLSMKEIIESIWLEILSIPTEQHMQSIGTRIGQRLGLTDIDAVTTGTELLAANANVGLYDLLIFDRSKIVRPKLKLSADVLTKLNTLQYQPPMTCVPNNWVNNHDGGWLSFDKHCIVGKGNSHNQKQRLSTLNKLQQIPWKIDTEILLQFKDDKKYKGDDKIFIDYMDKTFYFVWRYDKRGRMYSEGYNLNLQSHEYRKAMITMAEPEIVTEEGLQWLKVAIANAFGKDKLTFKERIKWFNRKKVFDTKEAEEPILATKMLYAYQRGLDGKPVATNMFLDATASGIQIMAALSNCWETAQCVNLVGEGREDIYDILAKRMNQHLEINDHVTRALVKYPLMTHYYNSKVRPRQEFNKQQLEAFYEALNGAFPGAEDVLESINSCWVNAYKYTWTLPDKHRAVIRSKITASTMIPIMDSEFYYEYTKYQPSGNGNHLSPNIIHSLDGYIAREMVERCDFRIAHIHDAFTAHPNNMGKVCETYRELLAEIADATTLQNILREITGNFRLKYNKLGTSLSPYIRASVHALS